MTNNTESAHPVTLEITGTGTRWLLNHSSPGATVEIVWKLTLTEAEAMVRAIMALRAERMRDQAPKPAQKAPKPAPKPDTATTNPRRTPHHTTTLRRGETIVVARYSVARRR